MDITLLKNFNNYFNRLIKRYENYTDYSSSFTHKYYPNLDFNPNDGVSTEQVINWTEDWTPDYLLTHKQETTGTVITGRWFITEWVRTRGKQYKATLKRDVVADFFEDVLNAPFFAEKGYLNPNSPLIYNKEGLTVNQIKSKEVLLADKSTCPWIVGYIAKDYLAEDGSQAKEISGKYGIELSSAIDKNNLPWDWHTTPTAVGPSGGYKLKVTCGSRRIVFTYGQYQSVYDDTAEFTMNYNKNGVYTSFDYNNVINNYNGSIVRYSSSSDFTIYASDSNIIRGNDVANYIVRNDLNMNKVPQAILDASQFSSASVAQLMSYDNKIVKDSNRYYRLHVTRVTNELEYSATDYPVLETNLTQLMTEWNSHHSGLSPTLARAAASLSMIQVIDGVLITPELISEEVVHTTIPVAANRNHLSDAPYDMFAIPYGNINIDGDSWGENQTSKEAAMAIAFAIASEIGSSIVYDIQLLPYCPCLEYFKFPGYLNSNYGSEHFEWEYIKDSQDNIKNIMIWCHTSTGTFNIDKKFNLDRKSTFSYKRDILEFEVPSCRLIISTDAVHTFYTLECYLNNDDIVSTFRDDSYLKYYYNGVEYTINSLTSQTYNRSTGFYKAQWRDVGHLGTGIYYDITAILSLDCTVPNESTRVYENDLSIDLKIDNECNMYRLVSPNYNGQFEFNIARNGGSIEYFNVDYTYKPYQPYIHINPNFKGLYGTDFDDARGLILGGDFSLPVISSAFTDYTVQNKNYQNIFDRQIQNMDIMNDIAKQEAAWGAVAGTVQGAASGAMTGALSTGSPWGAVAGAVVGGVASGVGGMMDYANLQKRQEETRSFTIDNYHYNLGNIQAIPYNLTRTSSFTYNNRIIPIVEYYTCTDEEKDAFKNKIKYDGMTVGKICTVADVSVEGEEVYVKGQLIRLPISDDSHLLYTIYDELNKGVYL